VREAIFNLLVNGTHGNLVAGARVLDLFAGTGALGLEALSRGAAEAVFVDDGAKALALLKANIAKMRAEGETRVSRQDATRLPPCPSSPATLVFLDPPYGKGMGELALTAAHRGGWLAPGATVVWEEAAAPQAPAGFSQLDQRRYGETFVTLMTAPA
jgi:16S rRNA (guanine966-N2)-methyltransferase